MESEWMLVARIHNMIAEIFRREQIADNPIREITDDAIWCGRRLLMHAIQSSWRCMDN